MKELQKLFSYRRRKLTKNLTDNEKIRKEIYWDINKLFKAGDPDEAIKYLKKLTLKKSFKKYLFLEEKKKI